MRRTPLQVWLLVLCLLAGRFALAAHDAQHAPGGPQAHACVACLHGGNADGVGVVAPAFAAIAGPEIAASVDRAVAPALRLVRPFQSQAPPRFLVWKP